MVKILPSLKFFLNSLPTELNKPEYFNEFNEIDGVQICVVQSPVCQAVVTLLSNDPIPVYQIGLNLTGLGHSSTKIKTAEETANYIHANFHIALKHHMESLEDAKDNNG